MSFGLVAQILGALLVGALGYFGRKRYKKYQADQAARVPGLKRSVKSEKYKVRVARSGKPDRLRVGKDAPRILRHYADVDDDPPV